MGCRPTRLPNPDESRNRLHTKMAALQGIPLDGESPAQSQTIPPVMWAILRITTPLAAENPNRIEGFLPHLLTPGSAKIRHGGCHTDRNRGNPGAVPSGVSGRTLQLLKTRKPESDIERNTTSPRLQNSKPKFVFRFTNGRVVPKKSCWISPG
jgi:hypothetical protein